MGDDGQGDIVDEGGLRRFAPGVVRSQRARGLKRLALGAPARVLAPWATRRPTSTLKAVACRRIVVPGAVASDDTFTRTAEGGVVFTGTTGDLISLYIHLFGVWEPNLTAFVRARLGPGDVFVDVGAHAGWFTLVAAKVVGSTGKVVAVEASPINAGRLVENVALNGLDNVELVVAAAGADRGTVALSHGPAEHTGLTRTRGSGVGVRVRRDTVPELVGAAAWSRCRLLKIDVEGAEYDVVRGLAGSLEQLAPTAELVVEVGPERAAGATDPDELFDVFERAGFRPYRLDNTYGVDAYLARGAPTPALRLDAVPTEETDVVFSRVDARRLPG